MSGAHFHEVAQKIFRRTSRRRARRAEPHRPSRNLSQLRCKDWSELPSASTRSPPFNARAFDWANIQPGHEGKKKASLQPTREATQSQRIQTVSAVW